MQQHHVNWRLSFHSRIVSLSTEAPPTLPSKKTGTNPDPAQRIIQIEPNPNHQRSKRQTEVELDRELAGSADRSPVDPVAIATIGNRQIVPLAPDPQVEIQHRSTGNFQMVEVQWQGAFQLEQAALSDRYIIDLVLAGSLVHNIDAPQERLRQSHQTFCSLDTAAISSSGQKLYSITSDRGKVLSIEIDRHSIESVLAKLLNRPFKQPIIFLASIDLTSDFGRSLKKFLHFLWDSTPGSGAENVALVCPELEEAFLAFIIRGLSNNYTEELRDRMDGALAAHFRRACAFIESHLHEDIKLGDIAAATSVCSRLLQKAFSHHCGCSPMRFVTRSRLERVRQELERSPKDTKIVDVMMDYGFTQGGKFAKEYQQLFGEKPSETLKRSSQFHQQHSPLWQDLDDPRSDRVTGGAAKFLPSMSAHTPTSPNRLCKKRIFSPSFSRKLNILQRVDFIQF